MSGTRHAGEGEELHQERWTSSPEFNEAINALVAAKRIALVQDANVREALWYIQWRSLRPLGLKTLADEMLARFPERVGTPSMRRFGCKPGKKLTREQVIEVREEIPLGKDKFPLRGEVLRDYYDLSDFILDDEEEQHQRPDRVDSSSPRAYSADDFLGYIREASHSLSTHLMRICLNPKTTFEKSRSCYDQDHADVWYFDGLIEALIVHRRRGMQEARARLADTEISKRIISTLDFCQRRRRMALIEGNAGIGKSATVKAWCEMMGGIARYVEIPSSGDERSFYSAIAEALGVARGPSYNGQQIKLRVEEALKQSGLLVVLDEAQFCWPQQNRPRGTPGRMQWIKTAFDFGAAIVLVGLPDFTKWQALYVAKTLWSDEQFERRLNRKVSLPESHPVEDLTRIARVLHPNGDRAAWALLAGYALAAAKKQASAIMEALESATDFAEQDGRTFPIFEDIEEAIRLDFQPMESTPGVTTQTVSAIVPQRHCRRPAKARQSRNGLINSATFRSRTNSLLPAKT